MKNILTENRNDASSDIDLANTKEIVKIINDEDKKDVIANKSNYSLDVFSN